MKYKNSRTLLCLLALSLAGCYKYKEASPLASPAYLRVFNSIPYNVDALHSGQTPPFLCFLFDPAFDAAGVPTGGGIVGDWLHNRKLFSLSYPIDAGTALNAGNGDINPNPGAATANIVTNANYEYPGKMHVLTAPPMNGMDMSAWAQVPSGRHRVLFVIRPEDNTPFTQLTPTLRKTVLIDTTIDLKAGEVYTLEALLTDLDHSVYGAYLRQEQFPHQSFDPGRLYATFYNLSGRPSVMSTNSAYPFYFYYSDTLTVRYTYEIFDENFSDSVTGDTPPVRPVTGANKVYLTTVIRGRDDLSVFTAMPFLSRNNFFDKQGFLKTYWEGSAAQHWGTMPYAAFDFSRTDPAGSQPAFFHYPRLLCIADPANFNTFDPERVNNSNGGLYTSHPGAFIYQPNLNMVVQSGGSLNFFPTVNIFEIIYNRVYLMQLQRQFQKVPE